MVQFLRGTWGQLLHLYCKLSIDVKTGGKNPSLSYCMVLIVGNPRGVVTTVEEASDAGTKK